MGKKSSGDVRQPMAGHAFAWLALLADCLHIGHTERVRGKGQRAGCTGGGTSAHYVCV